jgi:biopolymer transport protein ExbD
MAMTVGSTNSSDPDVLVDINTTPLIDVMLVLLIMLIITIPIQLHSVNLNMPVGNPPPPATPPEIVRINLDATGTVSWNGEVLQNQSALDAHLSAAAAQATTPELHVRPDKKAPYRFVASVMASIQKKGLTKVGLVGSEQFL